MSDTGMINVIYCPFCQRENEPDNTKCKHCGTPFLSTRGHALTTFRVHEAPTADTTTHPDFERRMASLPANTMALFVSDQQEIIVLTQPQAVILGRSDTPGNIIDLTQYGPLTLGISRHHARVNFANGIFTLEDLNSTNGTWVNRKRLEAGQLCELHHGDQLSLGPLKVLVGLKTGTSTFILKRSLTSPEQGITPYFFVSEVTPYLQALSNAYQAQADYQGKTKEHIYVHSLTQHEAGIAVHMTKAGELLPAVQKWVLPWRATHPELIGQAKDTPHENLAQLAIDILTDPRPGGQVTLAHVEKIMPALGVLVTSPLEPVIDW